MLFPAQKRVRQFMRRIMYIFGTVLRITWRPGYSTMGKFEGLSVGPGISSPGETFLM